MSKKPLALLPLLMMSRLAFAGPPYISDDPEPTPYQHYEIYLFAQGEGGRDGVSSAYGVDFNYGAGENLQLTAAVPVVSERSAGAPGQLGVGNIELAAKYRFAHQADIGWDIAVFPRVFLRSASDAVGDQHASFLLPMWFEHDWDDGKWGTFGGGGCVLNRGGDAKDFCRAGWALTRQLSERLQLGVELVHQGADTRGGSASTQAGLGAKYDLGETLHVLAYAGPSLQNVATTTRYDWYTSLLLTF
jgi:hypothetical protein